MLKENSGVNVVFRVILFTLAGSFLYAMVSGIRNNYGIMLNDIVSHSGISFTSVSFVLAVGQLIFGAVQPAFGILAAKKGSIYALVIGVILTVSGMFLLPLCKSILTLMLCLGFILPAGTGAVAYGVIMGAISPKIPPKAFSVVSGIVNASSGIGNTVMSPIINSLIKTGGLMHGMLMLSIPALLMLPVSVLLGKKPKIVSDTAAIGQATPKSKQDATGGLFKRAFGSKAYLYLMLGFFTCGFHMALITNHLPTQFVSYGFSSQAAANAFSIYGITTLVGAITSGQLCGKRRMKNILGFIYGLRPITIALFFLLPKTLFVLTAFTALLGLSGSSTVSPVSGIINKTFGAKSIAALFGFVLFIHQIGGFLGVWLGGVCFSATGSYTLIWSVDILLSTAAAGISLMIKD